MNNTTVALDICASGGGIKPKSLAVPVYVSIPIPKHMSADKVELFHVSDKAVEEVEIVVEDGTSCF